MDQNNLSLLLHCYMHPELVQDCTPCDNNTPCSITSHQCSIMTSKNSIPEWKNKNEDIVVAWNHCLFHDTFGVRKPGNVTVFKSHISMFHFENTFFIMWMWKQQILATPITAANVTGREAHTIKQYTVSKNIRSEWLRVL